jgi:hypothetical protein
MNERVDPAVLMGAALILIYTLCMVAAMAYSGGSL